MKIRLWHWWVYRLYVYLWTPILKTRPGWVVYMRDHMNRWLSVNAVERAANSPLAERKDEL
jgi:hypothetical protein